MMKRYGETRKEVRCFSNADFFEFVNQREGDDLDFILSKTILGFSDFVHEHKPDLVVIHGDRIESLAASLVCALRYIRSCHIEGGEVSGTIDESIRHCNTKLCNAHFVSGDTAYERVISLGESPQRTFKIGSPELDVHSAKTDITLEMVKKRYEIKYKEYGIVIFHPVTSELDTIEQQAKSLFSAIKASKKKFIVILPNNDPGTELIIKVIDSLPKNQFRIIASMRFNYFSELMKNASLLIGNSSAGVREAPFMGVPSLDIGSRQNKRISSNEIEKCTAFEQAKIKKFIAEKWGLRVKKSTTFGNGKSTQKFIKIITDKNFWILPMQKTYHENKKLV